MFCFCPEDWLEYRGNTGQRFLQSVTLDSHWPLQYQDMTYLQRRYGDTPLLVYNPHSISLVVRFFSFTSLWAPNLHELNLIVVIFIKTWDYSFIILLPYDVWLRTQHCPLLSTSYKIFSPNLKVDSCFSLVTLQVRSHARQNYIKQTCHEQKFDGYQLLPDFILESNFFPKTSKGLPSTPTDVGPLLLPTSVHQCPVYLSSTT